MRKIDIPDIIILIGFFSFSYGVAVRYSVPDMCIISGVSLILGGLFFARAAGKVKK